MRLLLFLLLTSTLNAFSAPLRENMECAAANAALLPFTESQKQALEKYRAALIRYRDVFERQRKSIERGDPQVPRTSQKNVSRALERALKAALDGLEIPHRAYVTKNGQRIYVDGSSGHGLGRLVAALKRAGVRSKFESPQQAMEDGARGSFDGSDLFLSYEILLQPEKLTGRALTILTPTAVEKHEARHFGLWKKTKEGKPSIYLGEVWPREDKLEGLGVYGGYLSFEEAMTYSADYYDMTLGIRRILRREGPTEADIKFLRYYVEHLKKAEFIPEDPDRDNIVRAVQRYSKAGLKTLEHRSWMTEGQHVLEDGTLTWADETGYTSFEIVPATKNSVAHVQVNYISADGDAVSILPAPEAVQIAQKLLDIDTPPSSRLTLAEKLLQEHVLPQLTELQATTTVQLDARQKANDATEKMSDLLDLRDKLAPGARRNEVDQEIWRQMNVIKKQAKRLGETLHR